MTATIEAGGMNVEVTMNLGLSMLDPSQLDDQTTKRLAQRFGGAFMDELGDRLRTNLRRRRLH